MTVTSFKSRGYESDQTQLLEQLFLSSLDEVLEGASNGDKSGLMGSRNNKKCAHDIRSMPGIGISASFDDIRDEQHDGDNSSMATCDRAIPPSYSTSSNVTYERVTLADAYNKGMLLEYFAANASQLDCCSKDCTVENYETKWEGHQPLTPTSWTHASIEQSSSTVSASELRLRRSRRRRGIM